MMNKTDMTKKRTMAFMKCLLICSLMLRCASGLADAAYANHYVWKNSPSPGEPYHAWTNAAHDIQTAVNFAGVGDTVWVTNGIYVNTTSAINVQKDITLKSVNGAEVTVIDGNFPSLTNRCLEVRGSHTTDPRQTKLIVDGFTIRNGGLTGVWLVRSSLLNSIITGNGFYSNAGGGIYMGDTSNGSNGGVVSNCVISGNVVAVKDKASSGGGIYMYSSKKNATIVDFSRIEENSAQFRGGGISAYGIVSSGCLIENCQITGNVASNSSGGLNIYGNTIIRNCLIASNTCTGTFWSHVSGSGCGGGIKMYSRDNELENCTIVMNSASKSAGGLYGSDAAYGGSATGTVVNTIIDLNIAPVSPGVYAATGLLTFTNCYLQSLADVTANTNIEANAQCLFEVDTRFVDSAAGNYRLRPGSPCVNAGITRSWMSDALDLDSQPRILNDIVDMGAYETLLKLGTWMIIR